MRIDSELLREYLQRRRQAAQCWRYGQTAQIAASLVIGMAIAQYAGAWRSGGADPLESLVRQAVLSHELFASSQEPRSTGGERTIASITEPPRRSVSPVRGPNLLGMSYRPVMISSTQDPAGAGAKIALPRRARATSPLPFVRLRSASNNIPARYARRGGRSAR